MNNKIIKRVQAALNLLDPDQEKLYHHVKSRTNESAYLKRLIQRDMEGGVHQRNGIQKTKSDNDKKLLKELIL
jgi:hypothetical protein